MLIHLDLDGAMRFKFKFAELRQLAGSRLRRRWAAPDAPGTWRSAADVDPVFEAEIEQLVNTPIRLLAISAQTMRFYHHYRWESRYRSIRHWLLGVAGLNLVCAAGDPFVVASTHMVVTLACRVLISLAFAGAVLPLTKLRSPRIEGLCIIIPCAVLLLTTGNLGLYESPLLLERYLVNACFVIASGIVLLRVDGAYITALAMLTSALTTWFIGFSAIQPSMAKTEIILFHVGAMIALWNAHRVQKLFRYRSVLLSLSNEIQARKMAEMNAVLIGVTLTDPLTGIANRRHFDETLLKIDRDAPVAVLMIDIDHFKRLNDTFGHAEGDRCLRLVAQAITREVRAGDLAARYGGEEFAVLAVNADREEMRGMAERIRAAVGRIEWIQADTAREQDAGPPITISIGAAEGKMADQDALLRLADRALYEAKRGGRDRVVFAREDAGPGTQLDFFHRAA